MAGGGSPSPWPGWSPRCCLWICVTLCSPVTVGPAAAGFGTHTLPCTSAGSVRGGGGGHRRCRWPGWPRGPRDSLRLYCFSLSRQLLTHRRNICFKVSRQGYGRERGKCLCQTHCRAGLYPFISMERLCPVLAEMPKVLYQGRGVPKGPPDPNGVSDCSC